jgi:hypothetical protein
MKQFVLSLVAFFSLSLSLLAGPTIQFQTKHHDFGTIREEVGTITYDFRFTNTGNSPLLIYKALASCGCTTPLFTKEPIAPGASSLIKVTYSTLGRPGTFQKTITVYTNDAETDNVILSIEGSVTPQNETPEEAYPNNMQGLRLKRTLVPILDARIGSIKTEVIEMMNTNPRPVLIRFGDVPKHIRVTPSSSVLKPGQPGILTLQYIAGAAKDYGKREDSFYIYTSEKDKKNPLNRILVTANISEDFSRLTALQLLKAPQASLSVNRINFGKMKQGTAQTAKVILTNKGKSHLLIRKIVPEYDGMKVWASARTIAPGKTAELTVTFNAGRFDGNVTQRITLITNDPKNSALRLFVTAQVAN